VDYVNLGNTGLRVSRLPDLRALTMFRELAERPSQKGPQTRPLCGGRFRSLLEVAEPLPILLV
jgi:hypothetical protein